MYALADGETRMQLRKNKDFIICFPQIGFQLTPEDDLFESRLVANYKDVEVVKKSEQFQELASTGAPNFQVLKKKVPTEAIFKLRHIYPTDLTAKKFTKNFINGAIRFEVELKDGLKHGRYTEYYQDGTEKMTGRFRNDEQVGTWRYFDEEGKLQLKKRF